MSRVSETWDPRRPRLDGHSSCQDRHAGKLRLDPLLPFARSGLVDRGALRIDSHRHRHVPNLELVNRLHAEVLEGYQPCRANGFRYEISRAADSHQIDGVVVADRFTGGRPALGLP